MLVMSAISFLWACGILYLCLVASIWVKEISKADKVISVSVLPKNALYLEFLEVTYFLLLRLPTNALKVYHL